MSSQKHGTPGTHGLRTHGDRVSHQADTLDLPAATEALERLFEGNRRYIEAHPTHPHQTPEWRLSVSSEQHPFAVIVGCSDSRVPPEVIFDQGIGDLFVIRTAGHVVDDVVLGSIEYAVEHLHTPLVVLLGHTRCGAVAATMAGQAVGAHLPPLAAAIQPSVETVRDLPGDRLENCIRAHAARCATLVRTSEPLLARCVRHADVQIVAAYYDLETGVVELVEG